METRYTIIQ